MPLNTTSEHSFVQGHTHCKVQICYVNVDSGFGDYNPRLHHSSSVKKRASYATLDPPSHHQFIMGTNVMHGAHTSMNTIEERVKRVSGGRPMSAPRTGEFGGQKRSLRNKSSRKLGAVM